MKSRKEEGEREGNRQIKASQLFNNTQRWRPFVVNDQREAQSIEGFQAEAVSMKGKENLRTCHCLFFARLFISSTHLLADVNHLSSNNNKSIRFKNI